MNFIGQGVNMAQAAKNNGSLRVIILQNKLDTPHYAVWKGEQTPPQTTGPVPLPNRKGQPLLRGLTRSIGE